VAVTAGLVPQKGYGKASEKGKFLTSFLPEHVFVVEERLHLGVTDPEHDERLRINERFVHTHNGSSIAVEEVVEDVEFEFTVVSDWDFPAKTWATLWTVGQKQGIGAVRSQGFGRYIVTKWEKTQ